ncbi:MAG: alpha/beta hydrolase family protein [Kiloniellales bacterium]|nr:alpha/beta hydrolase family protein [Kiloniellales bacterium]
MRMAESGRQARHQRRRSYGWFTGPFGRVVARPWFDSFAFGAITYGLLPLSRAWAAAAEARGSVESFLAALPGRTLPLPLVRGAVARIDRRQRIYEAAQRRWQDLAFAPEAVTTEALSAAEAERRRAAHRFMAGRALFLPVIGALPRLRLEIAPPLAVEERHGARLASPEAAFPAPAPADVAVSQVAEGPKGPMRWLRFRSPVLGDTAWARIDGPAGRSDAPTVISLHGITIEAEMWRGLLDPMSHCLGTRLRVVHPEAPWHGRRRIDGWYGGEPLLGRGPMGLITGFEAALQEIAAMIAWARRQGDGPVILAGVSLGAITAQLYATAARSWPAELVPDALYLLAVSGDVQQVALDGCLAQSLDLRAALEATGWDEERIEPWLPLIQPTGPPALDPDRIVMLLGEKDCVMPIAGAHALARSWKLPEENLFQRRQGHFSVALGMMFDPAPWRRIFERLGIEP